MRQPYIKYLFSFSNELHNIFIFFSIDVLREMSIELEGESYNIEDEDLDEIEYLEIVSLDEIIKNNPSFIAYSPKDIYNDLFNIFKNPKKAALYTDLLFEIHDNNLHDNTKKDLSKYVFLTKAYKKDNSELNIEEDVDYFNGLVKLKMDRYNEAKNRYFFALQYDVSDSLTFKPFNTITTEIYNIEKPNYPIYYPIYKHDDVNLPVIGVYYRVPTAIKDDYLFSKIVSHYYNIKNIHFINTKAFTSIHQVINNVAPKMDTVLQSLEDTYDMDYDNISNFLKRFDLSLEFLKEDDYEKLSDYLTKLFAKDKERKNIHRVFKIKKPDIINNKLTFFEKFGTTLNLLKLSERSIELLDKFRISLNEHVINDDPNVQLLYDNIQDIITNIHNGNISLDQIIDNIRIVRNKINLNYNIQTINNLLKTNDEFNNILEEYEAIKDDLAYLRTHLFNYEHDFKEFISYHSELKEILDGNNEDNYEGIPPVLKNNDYENLEDLNNIFNNDDDIKNHAINTNDVLQKYWLNIKYKDEVGFVELLKSVLLQLYKIQESANIPIDWYLLCEELFANFRNVSTKFNILKTAFEENSITLNNNVIIDIVKIPPSKAVSVDLNMGSEIRKIIIAANNQCSELLNKAFVLSLSWWVLFIQEGVLTNTIFINDNELNPSYVDKWFMYGSPIKPEEKTGILPYLCSIIDDILANQNDNMINSDYCNQIMRTIEEKYKDNLKQLRETHENVKTKKKIEQGVLAQKIMIENIKNKKFDKIANNFIDALIYAPGVNYKKIHKFLLGCCLQKIGKEFYADIDLHTNQRKDLIDIKKKFATRKETNKARYLRFLPEYDDTKLQINEKKIKYIKIKDFKGSFRSIHNVHEIWLNNMYNVSALLPNKHIQEFIENTRKCTEYIQKYIKIILTTSRVKNSELNKLFDIDGLDYKSFLMTIVKTLSNHDINDHENISRLKTISIESINNIIKKLHDLNKIITDENKQEINRINAYICIRAMCLPCNPDLNINNFLTSIMDVPQNFVENNTKKIHDAISNYLKNAKFPSVIEITDFLNSKREENKQKKLNILNNKTVEDNQLISKLKQAGIKHDLMGTDIINEDNKNLNVNNVNNINDIYDNKLDNIDEEGESEYKLMDDDFDNDDILDRYDMGFIYSK
jgi:hypothetical protein